MVPLGLFLQVLRCTAITKLKQQPGTVGCGRQEGRDRRGVGAVARERQLHDQLAGAKVKQTLVLEHRKPTTELGGLLKQIEEHRHVTNSPILRDGCGPACVRLTVRACLCFRACLRACVRMHGF
eukprot:GHVU01209287.1.p1 GENE.GHVU01209287.1~~GHVU01209287.1.p1  ORF type:complete len:124 (-),score=6.03 GHVU01209287.1:1788-2159(-)